MNNLAGNIREPFPVCDDFLPSLFCFHILGYVLFKIFVPSIQKILCSTILLSDRFLPDEELLSKIFLNLSLVNGIYKKYLMSRTPKLVILTLFCLVSSNVALSITAETRRPYLRSCSNIC